MGALFHYKITVFGRVQGVGYRYMAMNMAKQLGLKGYVKNMYNGTVEMEIEGTEESVDEMIHWCKSRSAPGNVDDIDITEGVIVNYKTFEVRY